MAAYEFRVQIVTDDTLFFNREYFRLSLAREASQRHAVQKVLVDDMLYLPGLDVIEDYDEEVD